MSGVHQFSVEGMFARAEAQIIKRLLDEAVGDFRVLAQLAGEGFVPRVHPSGFLAERMGERTLTRPSDTRSHPMGEGRREGERSSDWIFDIRHSALVMIKVAHAVYHAHQRGVLHRDLKPSNILLDHEHEPHVSDFGLARQTDEDSSLTASQALIGTPAYLSPEVAMGGARQATVAADIYGLGAILYQALTAPRHSGA